MTPEEKRKNYRFTIWLQGPIGGTLERLLWRFPPWKTWTSKKVWEEVHRDKEFTDSIRRGMADVEAGRKYRMVDREFIPDEGWPEDGAQPDGWHREMGVWVKNDEGGSL